MVHVCDLRPYPDHDTRQDREHRRG